MKNKFTYKQIYKFLPVVLILFCIVAYRLSIGKTIELWKLKNNLSEKVVMLEDAPARISELKAQVKQFDNLIGESSADSIETRQKILEKTGAFCAENNLKLVDFKYPLVVDKGAYKLETNILTLEGDFKSQLRYIYNLEHLWKPGKVVSVKFSINKNLRTQEKKLYAYVYIQKIKK